MKIKIFLALAMVFMVNHSDLIAESKNDSLLVYIVDGKIQSENYVKKLDPNSIQSINMGISDSEMLQLENDLNIDLKGRTIVKVSLKTIEAMSGATPMVENKPDDDKSKEQLATLVHVGDKAPDFKVKMLNGDEIQLSELKGKVVLVNFWATWCGPCMKEFQEIPDKIVNPFLGEEFVLLPISRGETEEVVAKKMDLLKQRGVDFNVGLDPDKSIYTKYATSYIPRNFLVDKNGRVVFVSVGYDEVEFAKLIEEIKKQLDK